MFIKPITIICCVLIATSAFANIGGSLDVSYIDYEITKPGEKPHTYTSIPFNVNLYLDKYGLLPRSWGSYSGKISTSLAGVRGIPPLTGFERLEQQVGYSRGNTNTALQYGLDITSPVRWLPLNGGIHQRNNSGTVSLLERHDDSTILDSTFKTGVFTGAGSEVTDANFTLGYKDSRDVEVKRTQGAMKQRVIYGEKMIIEQGHGIWTFLPQIIVDYKKTKYGTKNYLDSLLGSSKSALPGGLPDVAGMLNPDETTSTIVVGKQQWAGGYKKISIGKSLEEQYWLGNLTGTYKQREWWLLNGDRYSIDVQYSRKNDSNDNMLSTMSSREQLSGFSSVYADFFAEWAIRIPLLNGWTKDNLFTGWQNASLKTFSTFEKTTDSSGKSVSLDVPIFYAHDGKFVVESAKVERKIKEGSTKDSRAEINMTAIQYKLTLNNDGLITYSPMINYSATDNTTATNDDTSGSKITSETIQANLDIATTAKLWQKLWQLAERDCRVHVFCDSSSWRQFGMGLNYSFVQSKSSQIERNHTVTVRANIVNQNTLALDLSHMAFFAENPQPIAKDSIFDLFTNPVPEQSSEDRIISKHFSTLSAAWSPNITDVGRFSVNLSTSQEFAKTTFSDKAKTSAYMEAKLIASTWGATINSRMDWCPQDSSQLVNESNGILDFTPNQIWQASLKAQNLYYSERMGGETINTNLIQTARYSIRTERREIIRLLETLTYSISQQTAGQTEYWSGTGEIHTFPRPDTDIYGKAAIVNRAEGKDMLWAAGLAFSRQKITFSGEWAEGWRSDGREERKWTVSLKMAF